MFIVQKFLPLARLRRLAQLGLAPLVVAGLVVAAAPQIAYAAPAPPPSPTTATLTVIKEVINDDFGSASPEDFKLYVFDGTSYTFVTNGEATSLSGNVTYSVGEVDSMGYSPSFSGDCDEDGNITLAADDNKTCTITNNDNPPPLLVSSNANGTANDLVYRDEDILGFDPATGVWLLVLDGSDVGLSDNDIDAFVHLHDGSFLISLEKDMTLAGVGAVDDADVLIFYPTSLGEATAGDFALFFDGSDVGLDSSNEDIDALDVYYYCGCEPVGASALEQAAGNSSSAIPERATAAATAASDYGFDLLISVRSKFNAQGIKANDEDILYFYHHGYGEETTGEWYMDFDGSDLDLTKGSEDISGLSAFDSFYFMTTAGKYAATGVQGTAVAGDGNDVFMCMPHFLGDNTACELYNVLDIGALGLGNKAVDDLQFNGFFATTLAEQVRSGLVDAAASQNSAELAVPSEDDSDEAEAEDNSEAEKAAERASRLFLPLLRK